MLADFVEFVFVFLSVFMVEMGKERSNKKAKFLPFHPPAPRDAKTKKSVISDNVTTIPPENVRLALIQLHELGTMVNVQIPMLQAEVKGKELRSKHLEQMCKAKDDNLLKLIKSEAIERKEKEELKLKLISLQKELAGLKKNAQCPPTATQTR